MPRSPLISDHHDDRNDRIDNEFGCDSELRTEEETGPRQQGPRPGVGRRRFSIW